MAEKTHKQISRTKEGVPIWDGDSSTFQEYEEHSLIWEQSIQYEKRYLCGPRLINELIGTAKRFVVGKRPEWVSFNGEVADFLTKYFKQSRRRKGETINDYITRKTEAYSRARQSLSRVTKLYKVEETTWKQGSTYNGSGSADPWQRPWNDPWAHYNYAGSSGNAATEREEPEEATEREEPEEAESQAGAEDPDAETQSQAPSRRSQSWNYEWQEPWWRTHSWQGSSYQKSSEDAAWTVEAPELFPDFVQGWYLLYDSGLDTGERNMVMAALKGDYTFSRVAQELRNQWSDEDLRKRDQYSRASGWMADVGSITEEETEDQTAWMMDHELSEEGHALVTDAKKDEQDALAMIDHGKRTLKQARSRQHQVRMSRKFYKTSFRSSGPPYRESRETPAPGTGPCLRCGGDHRTSACSKKDESGHNVLCFTGQDLPEGHERNEYALGAQPLITTQQAVAQGKAVIDGGATRTLGSVLALEKVIQVNENAKGHSGIESVDTGDRPVFGFGNSSKNQCLSTARLSIQADQKAGCLKVHTLDHGDGPILFSIESLRGCCD